MKLKVRNKRTGATKIMQFKANKQSEAVVEFEAWLRGENKDRNLYEVLGEVKK
jgi:hypothetical protein